MKQPTIRPYPPYSPAPDEQEMFRLLFETHRDLVYSYALRLTHTKTLAEDIVQDVFLKLWLNRHQLASIDNKEAWISRVTRNHCFNVLKRIALESRTSTVFGEASSNTVPDPEKLVSQHASQQLLDQAFRKLPPRQQLVFSLCHQEGLKYEEAANRLSISPSTVKTHMQHALRSIKAYFLLHTDPLIFLLLLLFQ